MSTETIQKTQTQKKRRKRFHTGPILIAVFLLLALGLAAGFYLRERQKPVKAVEDFLDSMQKMDFDGMSALLQSRDLSALDNADVRDGAYRDFFTKINEKMTYRITGNDFHIENGTARVTVILRYIDGETIYKESITEFLRQIVSTAFSGSRPTEEETQKLLSSILMEKSAAAEDNFTESQIVYPLIETNDEWKIVSLDDETVRIMSANFINVQDEINNTLVNMEGGSVPETVELTPETEETSMNLTTDRFSIRYTEHRVSTDFGGNPCLILYYDYTNNGSSASSAMVDVSITAYQNGSPLEAAVLADNEKAADNFMSEIKPGETVNVCQAFLLSDESDVTIQASEAFSFGDGQSALQILKL